MERLIARDWGRFTFHVYCLHCNLLTNHHQKGKNQHCSAQRKNKKRWNVNKGHNLSGKCTCTTVGITVQSSYIFWATNCHHNNYLQLIWAGCYWPVWMVFTLMRKRFTWEVWKDSWHMTTLTMTTILHSKTNEWTNANILWGLKQFKRNPVSYILIKMTSTFDNVGNSEENLIQLNPTQLYL